MEVSARRSEIYSLTIGKGYFSFPSTRLLKERQTLREVLEQANPSDHLRWKLRLLPSTDPTKIKFRYVTRTPLTVKGSFIPSGGTFAPRDATITVTWLTSSTEVPNDQRDCLMDELQGTVHWNNLGSGRVSKTASLASVLAKVFPDTDKTTQFIVSKLDPKTTLFEGAIAKGCKALIADPAWGTGHKDGVWEVDCDVGVVVTADCS